MPKKATAKKVVKKRVKKEEDVITDAMGKKLDKILLDGKDLKKNQDLGYVTARVRRTTVKKGQEFDAGLLVREMSNRDLMIIAEKIIETVARQSGKPKELLILDMVMGNKD